MLLSLFRKCCCILWNHLSYQQHIIWLFLLVLLSQQLQESDCKPRKWNRSIQRRFMWKQMDSTVDGFVDRVVTGARVVKSMIGDFMPAKQTSSNVMDYLPTETTRIRYIIRNPHTKETKVIRVKPSKKVVKLMAMTPKPLVPDKPKPMHINESQYVTVKPNPMHTKDTEHMTADKFKYTYLMAPHKLRKLEKEQELIAEGRIPIKIETKPIYMPFRATSSKAADNNLHKDDNIISGKITEFNESWKPAYKLGDTPAGFSTSKPYMMSALHTSVVGELLPEPQKQIYEPLLSNYFPEEEPKKSHTYEVTEYAAEESVIQPYTHDKHQSLDDLRLTEPVESALEQPYSISTATPDIVTQIEDDSDSKIYHTEYRSQRGFLPSRGSYRTHEEISTTTTMPSTTTTTEEPNYPALFLQKIRSRPENNKQHNSKSLHRQKFTDIPFESNWLPSNITKYTSQRTQQVPYHQHLTSVSSLQRIKSQKWPPDAEDSYLNSETLLSTFDVSSTTEVPILEDFTTQTILNNSNSRKNVRLKSPHYSSFGEAKYRSARQRGSVRYGDKLELEKR